MVRVRGREEEERAGLEWSVVLYVFPCTRCVPAVLLRFLCSSVSLSWTCGYDR